MLQTKPFTINEQLNKAKEYMDTVNQTQLMVSLVEKVNFINPVQFFSYYQNQDLLRLFWRDSEDSFYLVGIGNYKTIQSHQNRFHSVQQQWEGLLTDFFIPNDSVKGTGPLMLGGFSFNDSVMDDKWKTFQSGLMVVPEAMLTVIQGECYMTYNVTVNENTDVDALTTKLKQWTENINDQYESNVPQQLQTTNSLDYRNWEQLIRDAVNRIKNGTLGKVVLARELEAEFNQSIDLNNVLKKLVEQQKDSFIYIFDYGDDAFISATPERLVKVDENELLSTCLAGTIKRGDSLKEDDLLAQSLLNDEKNRSEHQYVVSMIKEAIEPLTHSIDLPSQPEILQLRTLQHLYTPVTAILKDSYTIFDLIEKLHPTPALGGEPRQAAVMFIKENEPFERGWYAGPVGWIDAHGNGEIIVAIRSALINQNKATLFAGCGIVEESDPYEEYEETKLKFTPMLEALGGISR
ncbi:isochorismate synthase [Piscibacillus halophilus]|uniref:Isochorismate synthase MenF n=1 Tax=Piscibacillus halophilus TaxID=571933 RepID=A0A1H9JIG4_9BACI|nr:isochorismate synthase [Piscibacillus halophilus]SEQ86662.1 isochorismate synthase [Piscibacillus halophilus]